MVGISYFVAFLAIVGYASLPVIAKTMHLDVPHFLFIVLANIIMSVFALVFVVMRGEWSELPGLSIQVWGGLVLFGLVNMAAFWGFLYATSHLPIAHYQFVGVLLPIISGILAWLILGEIFIPIRLH